MPTRVIPCVFALTALFLFTSRSPAAMADDNYVAAIQTFLRENFDGKDWGMVVGLIDEQGARVLSAGRLGGGIDGRVDGDTLFEIGSTTKTFTSLLLLDAARRGEVKLDDPVARYLPESVKVPARNGKQITLEHLAGQDSGLPFNPDGFTGNTWAQRYNTCTPETLYAALSRFTLTQDPGEHFQYSNFGMALLGHALERRTEQTFETLVVERICQPLDMRSTRMTLGGELKARFAQGHLEDGKSAENYELTAFAGAGGLRSSVNDLSKYVSANLGFTKSHLSPLMEQMHFIRHRGTSLDWGNTAMPWIDLAIDYPAERHFLGHAGGTDGYSAFIGFERTQRRGVVVLSNQKLIKPQMVGWRILQQARLQGVDPTKMMPVRHIVGVGVALDQDKKTGALLIKDTLPNSPAAQANVRRGLIVDAIDGQPATGRDLRECAELIRGPAGTSVRLEVVDATTKAPDTIELTRKRFLMDQ